GSSFFGLLKGPIGLFPLLARSVRSNRDRRATFFSHVVDRTIRCSSSCTEGLFLDRNETDRSRSAAPAPGPKETGRRRVRPNGAPASLHKPLPGRHTRFTARPDAPETRRP